MTKHTQTQSGKTFRACLSICLPLCLLPDTTKPLQTPCRKTPNTIRQRPIDRSTERPNDRATERFRQQASLCWVGGVSRNEWNTYYIYIYISIYTYTCTRIHKCKTCFFFVVCVSQFADQNPRKIHSAGQNTLTSL